MGKPTFDSGIPRPWSRKRGRTIRTRIGRFRTSAIKRRYETSEFIGGFKLTRGTETSQYPEERTSTETPLVVASESGPGQRRSRDNRKRLEKRAAEGESPVRVMRRIVLE